MDVISTEIDVKVQIDSLREGLASLVPEARTPIGLLIRTMRLAVTMAG